MTPSCEGMSVMNIYQLFTMPGTVLRVFSYIISFIPHVHSVREVNEPSPFCKQAYGVREVKESNTIIQVSQESLQCLLSSY